MLTECSSRALLISLCGEGARPAFSYTEPEKKGKCLLNGGA